jgi:hypothetical protein
MARHAFDPLAPRVAVYEIVTGFVAATAIGIAGEFASDKTVPQWLLAMLFFAGLGIWVAAVVWLFAAHRRLSLQAAGHSVSQSYGNVESPIWRRLGVAATGLVLVATVVAFALAFRADPSFASPYDGQDPNAADCVDAAVVTPVGQAWPRLADLQGREVGRLELRVSPKCGTTWAKVVLDADRAPNLKGSQIVLTMYRPADDVKVAYPLRLQGGDEGFSNMISSLGSCVRAEAYFVAGTRKGRTVQTACIQEGW